MYNCSTLIENLKEEVQMKKVSVVLIALSLALSMIGFANAGSRNGMDGGCGNCIQSSAATDPYRKFQGDTIELRQEMMLKRFDLQRENLKAVPDNARVAVLQAEIKSIQAKIQEIHTLSGLPTDKCDGECQQKVADCDKKSSGGCGKGMGGCSTGPCSQQK
jgi:hypothetical protein